MSEVINNMKTRRSIRKYKPDMIPEDVLNRIIEAGTYAATGMGKQSPIIIAVTVLADKARPTYVYDGSLVMGNLMLAAHAEGIGSCWIHRAKEEFESAEGKAFLKSLGIEGDYEGIGHCVLGYTDGEEPKAMPRKENYVYCVK